MTHRILAITLSLLIIANNGPLIWAAPPAEGTEAPDGAAPPPPPEAPPIPAGSNREPLIEVSVDSLEISESNTDSLGVLWGRRDAQGSVVPGQLNILEQSVPSLLDPGKMVREQLFATLQALIKNNQARILANPTLLTKSGFEANFLVGGEIPYPTVGQGGVSGVEFKKYGVSVKILPQLTPRKTIDAQINVGVSNPDASVAIRLPGSTADTPGLSSREAGTKVEVNDGETVVMAGIKQSRREKTVTKVPFFGSIPILGLLFRHKTETVVQTSLVLFVTFRLIK